MWTVWFSEKEKKELQEWWDEVKRRRTEPVEWQPRGKLHGKIRIRRKLK